MEEFHRRQAQNRVIRSQRRQVRAKLGHLLRVPHFERLVTKAMDTFLPLLREPEVLDADMGIAEMIAGPGQSAFIVGANRLLEERYLNGVYFEGSGRRLILEPTERLFIWNRKN